MGPRIGNFQSYSAAVKGRPFGQLPDVVRERIMESLPLRYRFNARLISKAWSEERVFGRLRNVVFESSDQAELQKPLRDAIVLKDYKIFRVKSWAAVRFILSKCRIQFLKSVIIRNCDFQDTHEMETIGHYFTRLENLELIQLTNLSPNSISDLVGQTADLIRFVFINAGTSAIFLSNTPIKIMRLMERNRNLTSLTIIDRKNNYNGFEIIKPLTYANIQITNSNLSIRESLEYTSRNTLQCSVEMASTMYQFNTYSEFSSITDLRIRNILRLPNLSQFPMLKILTLKFDQNITADECKLMLRHQANLEIFDSDMLFTRNQEVAELSDWCPKLKILMICVTFAFYPYTLSHLRRLKLEKFDLYYIRYGNLQGPIITDNALAELIHSLTYLRVFTFNHINGNIHTIQSFFQKARENPHQMYFIYTPYLKNVEVDHPSIPFNVSISKEWIHQEVLSLPTFRSVPLNNFDYWMWKKIATPPNPYIYHKQFNEMFVKMEPILIDPFDVLQLQQLHEQLQQQQEFNFSEEDLMEMNWDDID